MTDKAQAAAEECFKKQNPQITDEKELEYFFRSGNSKTISAFHEGVEWLKKELLEGGGEFNSDAILSIKWESYYSDPEIIIEVARYQHSQDLVKIQALRHELKLLLTTSHRRIQDLEAEISRLKQKYEGKFEGRA